MKLWIIPLGGKGLRVKKFGKCKPLIKIKKKFIIEWFLISIKKHIDKNDRLLVIFLEDIEKKFFLKKKITHISKKFFKSKNIFMKSLKNKSTLGPAETIFLGLKNFNFNKTAIVANHDQYINFEFPSMNYDAFMPIYFNNTKDSSYVKIRNNHILSIAEKKRISFYASSGIYGFKNLTSLKTILKKALKSKPNHKNEFYVGPSINFLIKKNKKVIPTKTNFKFDLGSPKGIGYFKKFLKNF